MSSAKQKIKPAILCILDGWGTQNATKDNAIALAETPNYDRFLETYHHTLIGTDGPYVGLPDGQMGNSEVGHMNIGAGRVALPEFGRIDAMLGDGSMKDNPVLLEFIQSLKTSSGACHLMGLLSPGGVHSHQDQMLGFAHILAENDIPVHIHAFADGRDMPPQSAMECIADFENNIKHDLISVATLSGRFYAMDRDNRWERIKLAYDAIVSAEGDNFKTAGDAIKASYTNNVTDEFIVPVTIGDYSGMQDGDAVLMTNFRADRAREILMALLYKDFDEFERSKIINFSAATGAIKYSNDLEQVMSVLVRPLPYPDGLGETISKRGLKQLRIAETEKYAHVTFFFNGGSETIFEGEDRILVPSPKVRTYDLKPEMSAPEVTDKLIEAIHSEKYDYIIVNFANADMVGHTGVLDAAIKAIETVDNSLGQLEKALEKQGGIMFVTADHGNAEMMKDPETGIPHTQHTTFKVPAILVDPCGFHKKITFSSGKLADIAPTMLWLTDQEIPDSMSGVSLTQSVTERMEHEAS